MTQLSHSRLLLITSCLALFGWIILQQLFHYSQTNSLIVVHVILGSVAFLVGGITLLSKKGSALHKASGKLFYHSMLVSVSLTLVVALLPNHFSPTLFHIGILSLYFLIGGNRSIRFKQRDHQLYFDKLLAYTIVLSSLAIILYSLLWDNNLNPLRIVFGSFGIIFGAIDIALFNHPNKLKKTWLMLHLSKMLGGYTAAVTAFFVAQNLLSGYFNWFVPSVLGVSYIFFWLIKLRGFKPSLTTKPTPF